MKLMESQVIRLKNLEWVLKTKFSDNKAALAREMGVSANNISRFFSGNPAHKRSITDHTARAIERAAKLPRGWMDVAHFESADALEAKARPAFTELTTDELNRLEEYALFLISQREKQ